MMKKSLLRDYVILTIASLIMTAGVYIFKFPNNFSFGGVTGISILLSKLTPLSPGTYNLIINVILLVFGFIFINRQFGAKTVYVTLLNSFLIRLLEWIWPLNAPVTDEPMLELIFAITLPAVSAAILFNVGASSGGTDIVAMILKKYTRTDIGTTLVLVDVLICIASFMIFDIKTGLYSICGLAAKSLIIDGVIENINLCKYFTIICNEPQPICEFIKSNLHHSATIYNAQGAYTNNPKYIILTAMHRRQAVELRDFIKKTEPHAFILITNSSEIIGKGFRGFN